MNGKNFLALGSGHPYIPMDTLRRLCLSFTSTDLQVPSKGDSISRGCDCGNSVLVMYIVVFQTVHPATEHPIPPFPQDRSAEPGSPPLPINRKAQSDMMEIKQQKLFRLGCSQAVIATQMKTFYQYDLLKGIEEIPRICLCKIF